MITRKRLLGLKKWAEENLCTGREWMKAPAKDGSLDEIIRQKPRVYIAWFPTRPDVTGLMPPEAVATAPSILIMPNASSPRFTKDQRTDSFRGVHRSRSFGQTLAVSMLFTTYEPGTRLPGFVQSVQGGSPDPENLMEATETGLFTLTDWMDEAMAKILKANLIPGTDLYIDEQMENDVYSLYTDSNFVQDKRPYFYGFLNIEFHAYADKGSAGNYKPEQDIEDMLR